MQDDTRAEIGACMSAIGAIVLGALAGGCSMKMPEVGLSRSPAGKGSPTQQVPPVPVVGPESKAIDDGVVLLAERKYAEAEKQFRRAEVWYRAEGDRDRTAECLFWIGFCREKQGRTVEARRQYKSVIGKYAKTTAAVQARFRLGRLPDPAPVKPGS